MGDRFLAWESVRSLPETVSTPLKPRIQRADTLCISQIIDCIGTCDTDIKKDVRCSLRYFWQLCWFICNYVLSCCLIYMRLQLYSNIVITGGGSCMPGFKVWLRIAACHGPAA